jgi:hypothetical protein
LLPQGSGLQGKSVAWYEKGMNIRDDRKNEGTHCWMLIEQFQRRANFSLNFLHFEQMRF